MDLDDYDRVIASFYDAGRCAGSFAEMFARMCSALDANAAGVSAYDEADGVITHTLTWPHRGTSARFAAEVRALNDDAGAQLVTGARLGQPRRFSDIVPASRLRYARWFREQSAMTGLEHGMAADVIVAGTRLRVFAMRDAGSDDFAAREVDLLGRLAAHLGRAFTGALTRLSPAAVPAGIGLLVYHADRLAPPFRAAEGPASLARRYGLTAAETRVLAAMADGASRRAAAQALGIGANSLKSHMRRIYAKTGARRLPGLMLLLRAP